MSSGTVEAKVITLETAPDARRELEAPNPESTLPLGALLPPARLVEVSGQHACARTTTAVSCVIHAQAQGELVAWVQPRDGALFPPDLDAAGVDLDALVAIHIPRDAGPVALVRAAEWLARSGAFGLTVIDLTDALPAGSSANWQGRLQGVLRQYQGRVLLLTSTTCDEPSSGPLVGLRIEPQRGALRNNRFEVHARVLKDKIGLAAGPSPVCSRAPAGLRGAP
ncbi:MAG: recombinase A [Myxococcota bacterium]